MMPAMYIRLYSGMPYESCRMTESPQLPAWNMPAIVAGNARIDDAKMTGMTRPCHLERMWVLDPPYIRRPTTRLAYCTVTRRLPRSMKMIAAMTATKSTIRSGSDEADLAGAHLAERRDDRRGSWATIPAKMMSDIPLPMPRS